MKKWWGALGGTATVIGAAAWVLTLSSIGSSALWATVLFLLIVVLAGGLAVARGSAGGESAIDALRRAELFRSAAGDLISPDMATRLSGIGALGMLRRESPEHARPVRDLLLHWARSRTSDGNPADPEVRRGSTADLAAAVKELGAHAPAGAIDLSDCDLSRCDLAAARLSGILLARATLDHADLRKAYIGNGDLTGASLRGADLTDSHLAHARLSDARMQRADLTGADLRDADLAGADLAGTTVTNAQFIGADLRGTVLEDVDLRAAKGLSPGQLRQAQLNHGTVLPATISWGEISSR
ncbi:pentapeptide repeat-containing protein [Amycolatopsis sp. NBC_01480]|uniref:pentapeptide repeat-containing protein n=1 Tax=Amycolatopsis sp. NBC_01480 TaxID=2903562 RepID=UPI002E2B0EAD|nr:pentapeptide repeat-containing protein [Amycolatopsis sp. NBC_01480]